jgi:carbon storage regulator CsrA
MLADAGLKIRSYSMLVLVRKNQESLMIGGLNGRGPPIVVTIVDITRTHVRIGITAESGIPVDRSEVHEQKLLGLASQEEIRPKERTGANSHVAP